MKEKVYPGSYMVVGFLLAAAGGCDFREPAVGGAVEKREAAEAVQGEWLKGGREVFRADFEGSSALEPSVWNDTSGGGWRVESGVVHSKGTQNKALWLRKALPEKVRVEFDARSGSVEGDIKFEVFGDGQTHESGYIAVFGGWKNTLNIIARLDEHGEDRCVMNAPSSVCRVGAGSGAKVVQGQTYRMAVVRVDHVVRWYVDGVLFLEYADGAPLLGRHLGFNDWAVPLFFDNLVVYDLGEG